MQGLLKNFKKKKNNSRIMQFKSSEIWFKILEKLARTLNRHFNQFLHARSSCSLDLTEYIRQKK